MLPRVSVPVLIVCSFSLAVPLYLLMNGSGFSSPRGGYAALSVDALWPDRYIGGLLSRGMGQGNYISESTQWVFFDDFGELKRIPLDEYRERVESFDPRDDGYAARLASFFIRDGRRYFFLPLSSLEQKRLRAALPGILGEIPYTVDFLTEPENEKPLLWYALLFAGAALAGLVLVLKRFPETALVLPLLAVPVPLGSRGLALSAVLAALAFFLREFLESVLVSRPSRRAGRAYRPLVPRFSLFFAAASLVLYGGICLLGGIRPAPAAALLLIFCGFFSLVLWIRSKSGSRGDHIRFVPVMILGSPPSVPAVPPFALPFALAALLALLPPLISPAPAGEKKGPSPFPLIGAEEYIRHVEFQAAFSLRPIPGNGAAAPLNQTSYLRYHIGADGLIAGADTFPGPRYLGAEGFPEIPPFPLESLMDFLAGLPAEGAPGFREAAKPSGSGDLGPAGLVFLFSLPALFRRGSIRDTKVKMPMVNSKRFVKRIAA